MIITKLVMRNGTVAVTVPSEALGFSLQEQFGKVLEMQARDDDLQVL